MKNMKYLNLLKLQCMALLMLGGLFISSCTEDDMTVGTVDEKLYEFHDDLLGYLTDSGGNNWPQMLNSDHPVICYCILI